MKRSAKWTFKGIVGDKDNWERYLSEYGEQVSGFQRQEVEKMLKCRDERYGFITYICLDCGEEKRIALSCKSRICSSCGKVHADEWSEKLGRRLFNVTHRHITFTIAKELWGYLEENPKWRQVLFTAANETLRKVMGVKPSIVVVMHPYGKDLKVNYHVHVLVTEGGLNQAGKWRKRSYINYKGLRRVWQYEVLTRLKAMMPKTRKYHQLIDHLFQQHGQGFYVHAEPKVTTSKGIGRYIGRYLRHPAIADTRIVAYDGQTVTFYYSQRVGKIKRRKVEKLPVLVFIHGVVRHIPPKQFKMVRYYGLYAPRKAEVVKALMQKIGRMVGRVIKRLGWRKRIQRDFGYDPLQCPRCGQADMELYSLTLPWRGKMITIGGIPWLFERDCLIDTIKDEVVTPNPPQPLAQQLAFPFSSAP